MSSLKDKINFRKALYLAIVIYGIFGLIDPLMMPVHYIIAWKIRYLIVYPSVIMCYICTFHRNFYRYKNFMIFFLLTIGQLGILSMIYVTSIEEPAFYAYYVGLILMILSSEFIFRLKTDKTLIYFILTGICYLYVGGFHQKMIFNNTDINLRNWFIGNMFFLSGAAAISLVGSYRLNLYKKKIEIEMGKYQKARDEAEEANRLQSSFLRNISHEIRTPLNGIIGFSKMISDSDPDEADKEKYLKIIEYSSNKLVDIVDSIIFMSEIQTGKAEVFYQKVDLKQTLDKMQYRFIFQAKMKKLSYESAIQLPEGENLIETDIGKFRFVINNLLSNALKFSYKGFIKFSCRIENDFYLFEVEDSGIGIGEEHLEKIFDTFYQADKGYNRQFGGNGLGLSICQSYINLLGGTISVRSTHGEGSLFQFSHPIVKTT